MSRSGWYVQWVSIDETLQWKSHITGSQIDGCQLLHNRPQRSILKIILKTYSIQEGRKQWLCQASIYNFGLVWPQPLITWPAILTVSCLWPLDQFSKYGVHNFCNGQMNGRTNRSTENNYTCSQNNKHASTYIKAQSQSLTGCSTHTSPPIKQKFSYRKQTARKLRTQYVEGIHRPKYYTVTLKSRLRDGHSRSLETEPLDRSYTTYYESSYLTLNIIVTLKCGLEVTQGHWKW